MPAAGVKGALLIEGRAMRLGLERAGAWVGWCWWGVAGSGVRSRSTHVIVALAAP